MLVDINKIKVSDRIRKDFGNIEEMAEDIKTNGLINPPVVTPDFDLIAGERRLRACKAAGFAEIEVNVMTVRDYEHQLKLEISENEHRKEFTFSERVEWARRLEQVEKLKAQERIAAKEIFPGHEGGQVRDIVAEQAGFGSGRNYDKAKYIMENATPEIIQQLDDGVIKTHRAFLETKKRLETELQEAQERAEEAELEKEQLAKRYKDAIPKDAIPDIEAAATERQQEENAVYVARLEKEHEARLKQQEKSLKERHKEEMEAERIKSEQLRSGYQRAKEELEALKLQQPEDFDEKQSAALLKKLQYEADRNTLQACIHIKSFAEKMGPMAFMHDAIANSSPSEKKRLSESLDILQGMIDQMRPAIQARKLVK